MIGEQDLGISNTSYEAKIIRMKSNCMLRKSELVDVLMMSQNRSNQPKQTTSHSIYMHTFSVLLILPRKGLFIPNVDFCYVIYLIERRALTDSGIKMYYRKLGWLWTDLHYFQKYLYNDELNSRFHMGISKYHVRATHIIYTHL